MAAAKVPLSANVMELLSSIVKGVAPSMWVTSQLPAMAGAEVLARYAVMVTLSLYFNERLKEFSSNVSMCNGWLVISSTSVSSMPSGWASGSREYSFSSSLSCAISIEKVPSASIVPSPESVNSKSSYSDTVKSPSKVVVVVCVPVPIWVAVS